MSVLCEGLHDPYCKAVAGVGYHARVWIPLRCELLKKMQHKKRKNYVKGVWTLSPLILCFSFVPDEGNRGRSLD